MYDTARRVALVKQRVRENTRRRERRVVISLSSACLLLGAAITLHATYNLLIAHGGAAQYIAYALPVLLVAAGRLSVFRFGRRE